MKRDVYQEVTDKLIQMIEAGTLPWRKDWANGVTTAMPTNLAGRAYNGVNVVLLWSAAQSKGYRSNRWGTFNQIREAGGSVRKGEKSTLVVLFKPIKKDVGTDDERTIPLIRAFNVFNVDQCDGIVPELPATTNEHPAHDIAEAFVAATGAKVTFNGSRAFYSPLADYIGMPERGLFASQAGYYATLVHELVHWTGHKSRLDRQLNAGRFGSEAYAFEELIAELGAAFTCSELGISSSLENHASYLDSWLKVLKQDKRAIFNAASQATKACTYLKEITTAKPEEKRA